MKLVKLILCIAVAFMLCLPKNEFARASSSSYARADEKYCYFCSDKNLDKALFVIPYTYCVEIIYEDGDWYFVKYAEDEGLYCALYGFCLKKGLTPVAIPPENIYLNMPVTVTFKPDMPSTSLPVLAEKNVTAAFYGTYFQGATAFSYVRYDNSFGYIYGANDNYALNEIPEEPPENTTQTKKSKDGRIYIAVGLSVLAAGALVALYFAGRKKFTRNINEG